MMFDAIDRRTLMSLIAMSALTPAFAEETYESHLRGMMAPDPHSPKVLMLVYPNMIALDLIGPMTVFKVMRWNIQLVWHTNTPLITDIGVSIAPNTSFNDAYTDPDVLFVPGGLMGTIACMTDQSVLDFLAARGKRSRWITSDCTGSLVLGAAGLLQGYDATSHWAVTDLLPLIGARHVNKRVVKDRNRLTGGGTTAGIDFGLTLAAELGGEEAARRTQLIIEYAPEPPFHNGTPEQAGSEQVAAMRRRRTWMDSQARLAAEAAGHRLRQE